MNEIRVHVGGSIDFYSDVDLVQLIRKYPREYGDVDLEGDEEWKRPVRFLHEYIAEGIDFIGGIDPWLYIDDVDIPHIRWSEDDYKQLLAICPEADLINHPKHRDRVERLPGPLDQPLPYGEGT